MNAPRPTPHSSQGSSSSRKHPWPAVSLGLGWHVRMAMRELLSQKARLSFYVLSIAIGVAAYAALAGFTESVLATIAGQTRSLLGGDVEISSIRPLDPDFVTSARSRPEVKNSVLYASALSMVGTVGSAEPPKLSEVRAIENGGQYPLLGELVTQPGTALTALLQGLTGGGVVAEQTILASPPSQAVPEVSSDTQSNTSQLRLQVGPLVLPLAGVVLEDKAREVSSFLTGPRVYVDRDTALKGGLLSNTSRFSERLLLVLHDARQAAAFRESLQKEARNRGIKDLRMTSHLQATESLERPLLNLQFFVGLIALSTLTLAVLGSANGLSEYLRQRQFEVGLLRCLGAPPSSPALIFSIVLLVISLLGVGAGVGLGVFLSGESGLLGSHMLGRLWPDLQLVPTAFPWHNVWDVSLAAVLTLFIFCLPALIVLPGTSPSQVLRNETNVGGSFSGAVATHTAQSEGTASHRRAPSLWPRRLLGAMSTLAGLALVPLVFVRHAPRPEVGLAMALAVVALFAVFRMLTAALLQVFAKLEDRMSLATRLGVSELLARRSETALTLAVAGFALFLTLTVQFVRQDLLAPLAAEGAQGRPNLYFVDVQNDQFAPARALIAQHTGRPEESLLSAPIVRARLRSIGGRSIEELSEQKGPESTNDSRRFRDREQNLTYRATLAPGENIVAGRFWPEPVAGQVVEEVSLERRFAENIQAKVGDRLVFDVQGVPIEATVTSLRTVTWQNWRPNFFIVLHPSLLLEAPQMHLLAAEGGAKETRERIVKSVNERFPNVTVFDASAIVERLTKLTDIIAWVVTGLAVLMQATAVLVLIAGVVATRFARMRHFAILRAMGASHRLLLGSVVVEFALVGILAGMVGAAASYGAATALATWVLDLSLSPRVATASVYFVSLTVVCIVAGLAGVADTLWRKPLDVLRQG